jgi:F-type H+-transporting ATPase subunit b
MNALIQDPMISYAVAFIIFMALAFVYGRKPALAWIDGEIAKIRHELDHANQLRTEAEAALAACKEKQAQAEVDAKAIVTMAQLQVDTMRAQAEKDLASSLERQQQLASERIRMAESEAIADVRAAAIDLAMSLARKTLASGLTDSDAARLIDQAIAELPLR